VVQCWFDDLVAVAFQVHRLHGPDHRVPAVGVEDFRQMLPRVFCVDAALPTCRFDKTADPNRLLPPTTASGVPNIWWLSISDLLALSFNGGKAGVSPFIGTDGVAAHS
jgi:hypothetical protein